MKVAVWDTYVKRKDGSVIHFDILVDASLDDHAQILEYGKEYLRSIGEPEAVISTNECQFCHMEEPTEKVLQDIARQHYHIVELHEIPAELPDNPTRLDLILHLRGHYEKYRFADLRGITEERVRELLASVQ
ncbi:MAG: hypothetical protein Kow0075_08800 [Salibacteraceae bacterium]